MSKKFDLNVPVTYDVMMEKLEVLLNKYRFISVGYIGKSIYNKNIPVIRLGEGSKKVIYIGAHHGSEWITSGLLLRFINEYCEAYERGGAVNKTRIEDLYKNYEISVIPMLNPDGVEISVKGVSKDNVMYQRLLSMNNYSDDFSHWQANGRGVDLNHNYNSGFSEYKKIENDLLINCGAPSKYSGEYPESELETGYLCSYVRFNDFSGALTLHSQGEEIYYTSCGESKSEFEKIAKYLSQISDYKLNKPSGSASYGGFTDWFIKEFDKPSFTIECGKGENPLPLTDMPLIYIKLRRLLFEAPTVICRDYH